MMVVDISGYFDIFICSDDIEFFFGQNVFIREIDDDDVIYVYENVKILLFVGKFYYSLF